jgi:hypothetical protein
MCLHGIVLNKLELASCAGGELVEWWKFRGILQNQDELSAILELTFDGPLL